MSKRSPSSSRRWFLLLLPCSYILVTYFNISSVDINQCANNDLPFGGTHKCSNDAKVVDDDERSSYLAFLPPPRIVCVSPWTRFYLRCLWMCLSRCAAEYNDYSRWTWFRMESNGQWPLVPLLWMQSRVMFSAIQSIATHDCSADSIDLHRVRGHPGGDRISTTEDQNHQAFDVDSPRISALRRRITLCIGNTNTIARFPANVISFFQVIVDSFSPHGIVCLIMPWYVLRWK